MAKRNIGLSRESFRREYTEWVNDARTREMRLNRPLREAADLVADGALSYEQRIALSTKAGRIGPFWCGEGAVLCFDDSFEGWKLIKRGLLYSFWDVRITQRVRDFWRIAEGSPRRPSIFAWSLANNAAIELAIARPEAEWLLDLMESSLDEKSLYWLDDDFYSAFLIRLYRKLKGEPDIKDIPPNAMDWVHPFDDVIDSWDDSDRLKKAIVAMCDYHFLWNEGETEDHNAEFDEPFTIVNPIEIHALEAVRSELGLSTPTVDHELLQPPFYPIPEEVKQITTEDILEEDDLLRRIVELNQAWCDEEEK